MNDLEKEVVREKKYEENRRKMDIVKRNLMISRIYNVYLNLAVTLISAASIVYLGKLHKCGDKNGPYTG